VFYIASWIVGLTLGVVFAATQITIYNPIIYRALLLDTSFIYSALVNSFALITVVFFCYNRQYLPTILFLFLLGFSRGFSGIALYVLIGSGAWMMRILFLFSGICISVIAWWLILRSNHLNRSELLKTLCFSLIAALIVSIVDHTVISPFLKDITNLIF
jgi:hypothetical protein